jgi:UDP-N-acetylmuramoyl-tripeptide--D-alanyl-D-alanine ligase
MGKTTTRVFAATLLAQRYNVLQSPSNFNNEIGVPLSLLELESTHDVAILELGMNHAGEIGLLGQICRPNAALITNVAPVHLEFFNSVEDIARAKEEVLDTLQAGSTFFFNMDDPRVYEIASRYAGSKASYGFAAEADFRITYYQFHSYQEMEFEIKTPERYFRASVPFVGKHHLHNIAGAVALAVAHDLSWQEITAGLGLLRILPNRGQIANTGEIAIWDESYNSNPRAAEHLLATVESLAWNGRIILVLGDMLELGETSPELHRELGEKASGLNPAWLITVGEHARETANGAASAGTPAARLQHFAEAEKVAEFLEEILQPNDLLVVKGSRGVHLDRVIRAVRRAKA